MKRWIPKIAICLLLGLVTTVAIAWACAIWSDASFDSLVVRNATQEDMKFFDRVGGIAQIEVESNTSNYTVIDSKGFGVFDSFLIQELPKTRGLAHYSAYSPRLYRAVIMVADSYQTGWPLRCFTGAYYDQSSIGLHKTAKGKFLYKFLTDEAHDGIQIFYVSRQTLIEHWQNSMSLPVPDKIGPISLPADRFLPLNPIWSGFIINTIFFATVFWLMMLFAEGKRRYNRLEKGNCPKCNYQLRCDLSQGCPECGWGREAEV